MSNVIKLRTTTQTHLQALAHDMTTARATLDMLTQAQRLARITTYSHGLAVNDLIDLLDFMTHRARALRDELERSE